MITTSGNYLFRKHLKRTLAVAWIEALLVLRDRTTLTLILVIPAVQMALFGYAIKPLPENVPVVLSGAPTEAHFLQTLQRLKIFKIVGENLPKGSARQIVKERKAVIGIEFPPDEVSDLTVKDDTAADNQVQIFVDDSDPQQALPALTTLEDGYLKDMAEAQGTPVSFSVIHLYNPDNRHDWAVMPGIAGVVVMISMLLLGALSLVREREQGTWEALLATPVNAIEALLGKLAPYLLLGTLQAATVVLAGWLLFQIPVKASILWLLPLSALYAFAHLSVGFAISALAKRQVQAIQGAVFFYLPSMLLSGFLYPFTNMPVWAQYVGSVLPLTHFIIAARGIILQQATGDIVLQEAMPILGFTVIAVFAAVGAYRTRI